MSYNPSQAFDILTLLNDVDSMAGHGVMVNAAPLTWSREAREYVYKSLRLVAERGDRWRIHRVGEDDYFTCLAWAVGWHIVPGDNPDLLPRCGVCRERIGSLLLRWYYHYGYWEAISADCNHVQFSILGNQYDGLRLPEETDV